MEHGHLEQGRDLLGASKRVRMQARRRSPQKAMFSRLGGQPLLSGFLFPLSFSLFFRACIRVPPFPVPFFSCSLLGPRSLGMTMSVLHFLYLVGPYTWNVGNVCFIFLLYDSIMHDVCMCVCVYIYAFVCVGDRALCMMESHGVSDPL